MSIVDEIRQNPELGAKRLDSEYRAGLTTLANRFCNDAGDAEELVNRTFAEVVANIDRYAEQSAFFGWMSKILVHLHAKDTRRKSNELVSSRDDLSDVPDDSAQDEIFRSADHSILRDAISDLPKEMRDTVVMRYFMDLPISRVAKLLAVPEGTVNSRLHNAKLALAAKLGPAAKSPAGKSVIAALALCGLAALGAGVALVGDAAFRQGGGDLQIAVEHPDGGRESASPLERRTGVDLPSDDGGLESASPLNDGPSDDSGLTGTDSLPFTNTHSLQLQPQGNNMNTTAKSAALFAAAFAMQAAVPLAATGATLTITTSDASGKSSFDTWNVSGGGTAAPSPDNDYVVSNGKYIRVLYDRSFNGNTISFGAVGGAAGDLIIQRADAQVGHNINFANGGAYLNNGHFRPWESNRTPNIGGTAQSRKTGPLIVCSPESSPFQIVAAEVTSSSFNTNNSYTISAPIKGAAGTALKLCAGGNAAIPAKEDTFTITGSMAEFYGKLIVSGGLVGGAYDAVPVQTVFDGIAMGGTVVVQKGAQIKMRYTDRTLTTAGLELKAGSILLGNNYSSGATGKFAVTDSLTVEPGAIVKLSTHPYVGSGTNAIDYVLLTLPASKGTIPLENFVCPDVDGIPPCSLVTNLVDGVWQLTLHKEPHDVLMANDSTDTTISKALPSALTNSTSWLSEEAPRSGRMYVANAGTGGLGASDWPRIRTPYYSNTATPFVFAGDCLALGQGGAIYPCSKDVTFPVLNLSLNTTYILSLANVPSYLRGKLYLRQSSDTYPQRIQAYMRGLNTVAAEVSGPGTLHVMGRNGSSNPYGDIEFTALNTNYTGRIKVYASVNNVSAGTDDYTHERVFVADARNLGGPLAEFRADALELADYSVLEARNDVDMNVANRGITVTGNAGFAAPEGATLAISNDITWNGTARKTGAGTLALGGKPLVASGATAALAVEEGCLAVRSTNAVDGVSVSFEDGAYLLVDPAATGDIATFGAVALGANPFDGTLPVAFDLPESAGPDYAARDIAVCTVANKATADALATSAAANTRKMHGLGGAYSTRVNADGTATVLASISPQAFVIVVR